MEGDEEAFYNIRADLPATDFPYAIQNAWAAGKHESRMPFIEINQGQMNPHGERKGEGK